MLSRKHSISQSLEDEIAELTNKLNAIKDYIVETGTSTSWYWEKYNSGRMHMRGRLSVQCRGGSAWGSIYYDSGTKGGWAYPKEFKAIKSSTVNVESDNGEFFVLQSSGGSTTKSPTFFVGTGSKNTELTTAYAIVDTWGTWK